MITHSQLAHRVVALERLLNLNDTSIQNTFHLTPACSNLLGLLLYSAVPFKLEDDYTLGGVVNPRATVARLRRQVQPYGIEIHTRRGHGYFITPDTKQRILAMLEPSRQSELPLPLPPRTA